ncbi:MAG: hypothetical protein JST15_09505 [Bacteroidetes bacterium]|nr:hypothetical protein [Bacteroidota bacterium]
MGEIILKIPKKIKLEYRISDQAEAEKLIDKFEKMKSRSTKKKNIDESIVGIWKNRFPTNQSSVENAKELRKKAWTRS